MPALKHFTVFMTLGALAFPASAAATNDTHWSLQWGPRQVRADQAWSTSTGTGTVIAVVDSGIDIDHPDLAGKVIGGTDFVQCPDTGCGTGDFQNGDPHGTHVAGTAAAVTNNGVGVAGVAPDAKLLAVRVLDADGNGDLFQIANGIRWAADHGADVINLSVGGIPGQQVITQTLIPEIGEAVAHARAQGSVVVAAAGNDFVSPLCSSPGFEDGALCVTSTGRNGEKSSFSNFGVNQRMDVVAAPGGEGALECVGDIISTVPPGKEEFCSDSEGTPGYDFYAGTSMATPHVAGVAALLAAQGRTDDQIVQVLKATARKPVIGAIGVYDPVYGYGIVDAAAAVGA